MPRSTQAKPILVKSSAFKEGGVVPQKFTCDGADVNPLLEIRDAPDGTQSLALVMDDPDATRGETWYHWLVWNIDPKTQYIDEDTVPFGAVQGTGSGGKAKYMGPCPPRGNSPHRYRFNVYALDASLDIPAGSDKAALTSAMSGHVLAQGVLIGLYGRK
ncbi:YbhB/YbcL family Raf kinase inhibitor-like protein [Patescibacteria group bacterium]|nr:YbhB/YbcL family Raf kinase inhibitor-like protein [Patescibacteria group bacterium]